MRMSIRALMLVGAIALLPYSVEKARSAKPRARAGLKPTAPTATAEIVKPTDARDSLPVAAALDRDIDHTLAEHNIPASPAVNDSQFIRRATIDILGCIPTAQRVTAFLADNRADKRRRLIDELLADRQYGEQFGSIWYHLLVVPSDDNRRVIPHSFADWFADQFNKNRSWDRIVADLLTAEGRLDENPATVFWFAHSVTGVRPRDVEVKPADALGKAAQRFLGTQIQCAECHNHPFTNFKQTDFWAAAAFFGKLELAHADRNALRQLKATPVLKELPPGEGAIEIPESKGRKVAARLPDGAPLTPAARNLRAEFASWCTSPKNENFARAAVNRMWAHFAGRGFVDPVDDLRDDNPPSHPESLRLLAEEFTASGFDLKHLIRCICNSQAYQRSSDALPANADDDKLFSHMALKAMGPEVLMRSLGTALGKDLPTVDRNQVRKKAPRDAAVKAFRTSEEPDVAEYSHGIPQVLRLMNGNMLNDSPTLQRLVKAGGGSSEVVEGLYLTALSRRPNAAELRKAAAFVAVDRDPAQGYAALLWVLLNTSEFILNH